LPGDAISNIDHMTVTLCRSTNWQLHVIFHCVGWGCG